MFCFLNLKIFVTNTGLTQSPKCRLEVSLEVVPELFWKTGIKCFFFTFHIRLSWYKLLTQ